MSTSELPRAICLVATRGMPGAPTLRLTLLYNAEFGDLNGNAEITQAVAPPAGRIVIHHVTGQVYELGPKATRVTVLRGEYLLSAPPPGIGSCIAKFEATFVTDNNWQGHGTFSYGEKTITNVPVNQCT